MAITISGENNNDKILASDGVIDSLSSLNISGIATATTFVGNLTGNVTGDVGGNLTGNVTGNINNTTLLLQTGGNERLRITSGGYLKVTNGGTSDFNTIQRASTSNYAGIRIQDADATQRMQVGVAGGLNNICNGAQQHDVVLKSYANLLLATNQTERLRITSDGVIIGRGELRLTEGTGTVSNGSEIGSLMYTYPSNDNKNAKIVALSNGGSSGADLAFFTRTQGDASNSDGGVEKLRIKSDGKVGIGTDNPSTYRLHLQGTTSALARFERTGGAFAKVDIKAGSSSGNSYLTFSDTDASEVGHLNYEHADNSLRVIVNSNERLRINSDGYITKPYHPSFCARQQSGDGYVSTNIFRLTLVNDDNFSWNNGGHYSTSTGKFTAPVAGVYYFEAQAMTTGHSNGDNIQDMLQLRTNNGLVTYARQRRTYFRSEDDANGYYTNSTAGQVNLAAGDTVWFQRAPGKTFGYGNTNYTYFTGWLIG